MTYFFFCLDMAISDQNGTQQHRGAAPFLQDLILNHRQRSRGQSNFHRLQFRRMYRYGLSLLLVGVLCNWIGFAQNYFTPVRYLGVGCIIAGILCICLAFCRWLTMRSSDSTSNQVCENILYLLFYFCIKSFMVYGISI